MEYYAWHQFALPIGDLTESELSLLLSDYAKKVPSIIVRNDWNECGEIVEAEVGDDEFTSNEPMWYPNALSFVTRHLKEDDITYEELLTSDDITETDSSPPPEDRSKQPQKSHIDLIPKSIIADAPSEFRISQRYYAKFQADPYRLPVAYQEIFELLEDLRTHAGVIRHNRKDITPTGVIAPRKCKDTIQSKRSVKVARQQYEEFLRPFIEQNIEMVVEGTAKPLKKSDVILCIKKFLEKNKKKLKEKATEIPSDAAISKAVGRCVVWKNYKDNLAQALKENGLGESYTRRKKKNDPFREVQ